jgi:peptidoglycan hydrolase-like protein with peptidoglycan-binding domain
LSRKRVSILFFVLVIVILLATGGWIAGSTIQSPAEAAARTAPPEPSPILVPIEERTLTSDVVTRGTARFSLPQSISIAPSALKPDLGVITTLPLRNTQLNEGDVIFSASGRPVFILVGEIPAYRDLVPGISGDDVHQLENALDRLGFDPGFVDGTYDERTSAAVADWYTSAGWEPFGATAEQLATIRALEQELATAINSQLAAEAAAATAPLAVDAAQGDSFAAARAAQATIDELTAARDQLARDLAAAQTMPVPEGSTPAAVQATIATITQNLAVAEANIAAAEAARGAAYTTGQAAIQAAKDAQLAAEREAQTAADLVARINADLEKARHDAGVKVPIDEVVFLPDLPVRVEQVIVAVGDAASGPVMTVTTNQLVIDASLPLAEAPLVKPDMPVTIDEPELGIQATGVVVRVADAPGTNGVDGFHRYLEILVDETSSTLEGFSLRLTIPVESTEGMVTVVPVSALSLAADGSSRVQVENNGELEFIVVEPGLSADGFVEVTPVNGSLTPGQLVVIGFQ